MSDVNFEGRVQRALRAPVPTRAAARDAIMQRVREAARDEPPTRALPFHIGRAGRHSLIGVALAAGIGSITALSSLAPALRDAPLRATSSVVLGDTVVDRLRDTLRLVRLIFDEPAARQVAVVGDFNGWRSSATPMVRDARTGQWIVTLALHDGEHRYAIVVNGARSDGELSRADRARAWPVLHVARDAY